MKLRLIVLSVLILVLVAACGPPPNLRDDSFLKDTSLLSGDPCEAPCWRNITPGSTAWRDALIVLEDDPELTNIETVNDAESTARLVNFGAVDGPQCCRVFSEDGQVVSAILTLLAPQMTLGELVAKFGEPVYVTGGDVTPDQALVSLIYPDIPLVLYVFGAGLAEGVLSESSEIIGSIYLRSADIDEILTSTNLYEWDGYGRLADIFSGEPLPPFGTDDDDETGDD